jgi:putative glutamine amidotransferase
MFKRPLIGITMDIRDTEKGLYQYIHRNYLDVIETAGGTPLALPILYDEESTKAVAQAIDGLILSGGGDIHPSYYGEEVMTKLYLTPNDRTDFDLSLLKEVMKLKKSILGICYGMQLMNVALGGSLYQDIKKQVPKSKDHRKNHSVRISHESMLGDIMDGIDKIDVISAHRQGIKEIGKNLLVSAEADDGIIEAIEMEDYPFLIGVQWHPEKEKGDFFTKRLIPRFVKTCMR